MICKLQYVLSSAEIVSIYNKRKTFGESESGGWLRAASTAVLVDCCDPELIPVTGGDVIHLRRRQRRLQSTIHFTINQSIN